jgi:hypothetical protein
MNWGMKVVMTWSKKSPFFSEKKEDNVQILRNVTEIHYNFHQPIKSEVRVAFESDIHSTGVHYPIEWIEEFETGLEEYKEDEF